MVQEPMMEKLTAMRLLGMVDAFEGARARSSRARGELLKKDSGCW